jgi:hypothetical protein
MIALLVPFTYLTISWSSIAAVSYAADSRDPYVAAIGQRPSDWLHTVKESPRAEFDSSACGSYSLCYMLGLICDDVNYSKVLSRCPRKYDGSSMRELQQCANEFGCNLEVVKCMPNSLDALTLPAISLLEPRGSSELGHFVVLVSVSTDEIELFDWNFRGIIKCGRSEFLDEASGYYLIQSRHAKPSILWKMTVGLTGLSVCLYLLQVTSRFVYPFRRSFRRSTPSFGRH